MGISLFSKKKASESSLLGAEIGPESASLANKQGWSTIKKKVSSLWVRNYAIQSIEKIKAYYKIITVSPSNFPRVVAFFISKKESSIVEEPDCSKR